MLQQVMHIFVSVADNLPLLVNANYLLLNECSALSGQEVQYLNELILSCQRIGFLTCVG